MRGRKFSGTLADAAVRNYRHRLFHDDRDFAPFVEHFGLNVTEPEAPAS